MAGVRTLRSPQSRNTSKEATARYRQGVWHVASGLRGFTEIRLEGIAPYHREKHAMLARRMRRVTPSAIMELIKTTAGGDYISFAGGLPDPALYPVEAIRECADAVLQHGGQAALQYGASEGYGPLREWIAELLKR